MSRVNDRLSRSELLRRRRAELARERQRRAPVVARPGRVSRPAARRRYAIAVGLPGARLHAPALPRLVPDWRWASGALALLLLGVLYLLWTAPTFRVSQVGLSGAVRVPAEEVDAALGVAGRPVFALRPATLEAALRAAFPEFSRVSVRLGWPNRVAVSVVEREPVLAWEINGALTWIDEQGYAFRPRGETPGLIAVTAFSAPPTIELSADLPPGAQPPYLSSALVAAFRALAPAVPARTPILYDATYGLGWQDPRGWLAYIGREPGDLDMKLRVYRAVADALEARGIRPLLISVEYPDAPYYRLEP